MHLEIAEAALHEPEAAAEFYESSGSEALRWAFIEEFNRVADLLGKNPNLGTIYRGNFRRFPLRRFPYNLIYRFTENNLRILAVAHVKRRPSYWMRRK